MQSSSPASLALRKFLAQYDSTFEIRLHDPKNCFYILLNFRWHLVQPIRDATSDAISWNCPGLRLIALMIGDDLVGRDIYEPTMSHLSPVICVKYRSKKRRVCCVEIHHNSSLAALASYHEILDITKGLFIICRTTWILNASRQT